MGLRKLNRTRCYPDRPEIRGMIFAIKDLVEVTQKS
jgi:ribosomal protein L30/L7E